tara:strand:+ start:70 stop:864 length:795 start_codon:yes stop_codon:yes gene_type:complete
MARKSTAPLGKPSKPYSQISDGKEVKVKGKANIPTKRQKTGMASLAASVVGGAYGKPIAMLAKNLSKPMLEKALQPLTGTKTGPSKQSIKAQLTRVREIADKEKSGQLPSKKLKDNKKESFVPKGEKNPTTSRASKEGTGKRVGYSKKMERTGKSLGRAERAMGGSGMGAVPMSATAKDKDKPKLAPRPKSKPVPKTKNKDTKEYSTTRRGLSGRNIQVPSNKKDANVIVDMGAISKKSTGGSVSKSKNPSFLNKGYGKALRGF